MKKVGLIAVKPSRKPAGRKNALRHCMTGYERNLERIFGKPGADRHRSKLRAKVYATIKAASPSLAEECCRQQRVREAAVRVL